MSTKLLKIISLFLTLVLLCNMLPPNVFANEKSESTIEPQVEATSRATPEIVEEVIEKRTEYSKQFKLSNGMHIASVYAQPVHYEKGGTWQEIDNTLKAGTDGTYTNTAGVWQVSLPQKMSKNSRITITKDGYTLSFAMTGELTGSGLKAETRQLTTESYDLTATKEVVATVETVDYSEAKAESQYEELVCDKLSARLSYAEVFTGTDVRYDLQSNRVKESVILESYHQNLRGYRYVLETGDMLPVLQDDGQILFYDANKKDILMVMPAPYMIDAKGEISLDVQVSLTGKAGNYVLTYLLPQSWLANADRAWPVVLDPEITADLSPSNIRDRTVSENTTHSQVWSYNSCGYHATAGIQRFYLKYQNLPPLKSSDVIVHAQMSMVKDVTTATTATVQVHKVLGNWESETITWQNKPAFSETIEDFNIVKAAGRYTWDVTDIARQWYAGDNTGMMFKVDSAVENAGTANLKQFYSSDLMDETIKPALTIVFRNNNGLESYWDYTASSAGRAGAGYVNDFTGNLVWIRSDIGFGGNRMPVAINHIYNANDSADNLFGLGYGWRTNYNQRVYVWSENNSYYVWEDADGTAHYFYLKDGVYVDEDGLELKLTVNGTGNSKYVLTDKQGNTSHFDTYGRLTKLQNNQQTPSSITITYTTASDFLIATVTDGAGRVYQFQYTNDLLSRIRYMGTGSTELSYVSFAYSNSNLIRATDKDGKYSIYTYSGHLLTSAQDIDGYKLTYAYNTTATGKPARVSQIKEMDGSVNGGQINIEYAHNQTTFTDHNGNKIIKQFNDLGNTVCVQDGQGHAQYAQYAVNNATQTGKGNQLKLSSNMQNTVGNVVKYSSFDSSSSTGWTVLSSAITVSRSENAIYQGRYGVAMNRAASGTLSGIYTGSTSIGPGTSYTFSAYVKTGTGSAFLGLTVGTKTHESETLPANSDWTRLQVSYTNNGTTWVSITPKLLTKEAGTFYMDCVQLESAPSASRYNMLENSDFRHGMTTWYNTGFTTTSEITQSPAPQLNNTAVKVVGNPTIKQRLKQYVFVGGNAGDSYVAAGWAKGDSAPLTGDRTFEIRVSFLYADNTYGVFSGVFNPDSDSHNQWQYVSVPLVAKQDYSRIVVELCYDYNVNTAYFDGIQLYKEEFGSSYTYDANGNITSVTDLQKQTTQYEYTNNNLTKEILPNGTSYTYTYDNYRNVKTATTPAGQVYTFTYDAYGNNTAVSVTAGGSTITSSAVYGNNGNTLVSTTDALGKTTTYGYDAQTNVLNWVQYPEDTAETRTEYTYDDMYRMASVQADTDSGCNLLAEYTYADDLLTSIETASTTYTFGYGDFGLRSSVSIGNRTLAEYSYTNDRNFYLQSLDYGNGDGVNYTYDSQGRLTSQTYEDGDTVTYQYDNDGALAVMTDSATGITTRYYYDFTGRTTKFTESASGYSHSVEYGYDNINNLTSQKETINGVTQTTSYTYDSSSRVTSKTTDGVTVSYVYDALGRISHQHTKYNGTTVIWESFTYVPNSNRIATHHTEAEGCNVIYSYTYDDNGNVLSVSDGTNTVSYAYDSANQLIRENNEEKDFTRIWTYDDAGNILFRDEYDYSTGELGEHRYTTDYTYGDSDWGDLLTAFDGDQIQYDTIGNRIGDCDWLYTWEHGRELTSIYDANVTWSFTYDANGMRTKRTDGTNTYSYIYNGSQLVQMTYNNDVLYFTYDASGTPVSVQWNKELFFYVTNLQGDVVGLTDRAGYQVATYEYDAWGRCITKEASSDIVDLNPLRYRGYVFDQETNLYYLQSRYYDPNIGRFLNADALLTGQGLLGNNMFAYCGNNPVNLYDPDGRCYRVLGFLWKVDCGKSTCPKSKNYDPSPPRAAVLYDGRYSGFLNLKQFGGKGFKSQGENIASILSATHDVESYSFSNLKEFSNAWNSLDGSYDKIYIVCHGYPGGISCAGESMSNSGNEEYSFWDLDTVSATTVYLYACNGATFDTDGNCASYAFAQLTGGSVWAVANGKLSFNYFTLTPTPSKGGVWSVTYGNTITIIED